MDHTILDIDQYRDALETTATIRAEIDGETWRATVRFRHPQHEVEGMFSDRGPQPPYVYVERDEELVPGIAWTGDRATGAFVGAPGSRSAAALAVLSAEVRKVFAEARRHVCDTCGCTTWQDAPGPCRWLGCAGTLVKATAPAEAA